MEEIKKNPKSLGKSLIKYIVAAIVAGFLGSMAIGLITNIVQVKYGEYIFDKENVVDLYNEESEIALEMYIGSENDRIERLISGTQFVLIPLWVILCLYIAVRVFYKKKLQKPIGELISASKLIAKNNLDFSIQYESEDEIGSLCSSFELMRHELEKSNRELWRQMEERKRVNAAFSHDLRTPLTVLKGQSQILLKYIPDSRNSKEEIDTEKVINSIHKIQNHIVRMEDYVNTMNRIQKLEDIPIHRSPTKVKDLLEELKESVFALTDTLEKELSIKWTLEEKVDTVVYIDIEIVRQVFDNLFRNAIVYGGKEIEIEAKFSANSFILTMTDDGVGFDEKTKQEVMTPFYTTGSKEHLGMGLYICKVLCEKHGGKLVIREAAAGAKVEAYFLT